MELTALERLQEERDRLMPTPPVGEPVVWYMGGTGRPIPALVADIEDPGKLKLKVFPWASFPRDVPGVFYKGHPVHEKPNNQQTVRCGSWDYVRKPPAEDYNLHKERLDAREKQLVDAQVTAERLAAEFQAKQAKAKANLKKRLPEILPTPTV